MTRPGPLRELPLEHFLHDPITSTRPNKRPLSPNAPPNLFSPAKRRILAQEGIFSPSKAVKSPVTDSGSGRFAPLHFQDLLLGPDSPARKLDFGDPEKPVAPSSKLFEGYFTDTPLASTSSLKLQPSFELVCVDCPSSAGATTSDRMSIHYPGFDIWRDSDPNIHATSVSETGPGPCQSSPGKFHDEKENLPPRRQLQKSVASPEASIDLRKGALLSPERKRREVERSGKAKSIPATPSLFSPRNDSITPSTRMLGLELSSGRLTHVDKDEIRRRKLLLAEEAEGVEEEDETEI